MLVYSLVLQSTKELVSPLNVHVRLIQESDRRHLSPPVATSVGPCGGSEIRPAQELGIGAWVPLNTASSWGTPPTLGALTGAEDTPSLGATTCPLVSCDELRTLGMTWNSFYAL